MACPRALSYADAGATAYEATCWLYKSKLMKFQQRISLIFSMVQALCQLFKAQLLMANDSRQAQASYGSLDACLAALQSATSEGMGTSETMIAQVRLHQALLRCLLLLSQGSIATLAATSMSGLSSGQIHPGDLTFPPAPRLQADPHTHKCFLQSAIALMAPFVSCKASTCGQIVV